MRPGVQEDGSMSGSDGSRLRGGRETEHETASADDRMTAGEDGDVAALRDPLGVQSQGGASVPGSATSEAEAARGVDIAAEAGAPLEATGQARCAREAKAHAEVVVEADGEVAVTGVTAKAEANTDINLEMVQRARQMLLMEEQRLMEEKSSTPQRAPRLSAEPESGAGESGAGERALAQEEAVEMCEPPLRSRRPSAVVHEPTTLAASAEACLPKAEVEALEEEEMAELLSALSPGGDTWHGGGSTPFNTPARPVRAQQASGGAEPLPSMLEAGGPCVEAPEEAREAEVCDVAATEGPLTAEGQTSDAIQTLPAVAARSSFSSRTSGGQECPSSSAGEGKHDDASSAGSYEPDVIAAVEEMLKQKEEQLRTAAMAQSGLPRGESLEELPILSDEAEPELKGILSWATNEWSVWHKGFNPSYVHNDAFEEQLLLAEAEERAMQEAALLDVTELVACEVSAGVEEVGAAEGEAPSTGLTSTSPHHTDASESPDDSLQPSEGEVDEARQAAAEVLVDPQTGEEAELKEADGQMLGDSEDPEISLPSQSPEGGPEVKRKNSLKKSISYVKKHFFAGWSAAPSATSQSSGTGPGDVARSKGASRLPAAARADVALRMSQAYSPDRLRRSNSPQSLSSLQKTRLDSRKSPRMLGPTPNSPPSTSGNSRAISAEAKSAAVQSRQPPKQVKPKVDTGAVKRSASTKSPRASTDPTNGHVEANKPKTAGAKGSPHESHIPTTSSRRPLSAGKGSSVPRTGATNIPKQSTPSPGSTPRSIPTTPRSALSMPRSASASPKSSTAIPRSAVANPTDGATTPRSTVTTPKSAATTPRSTAATPRSTAATPRAQPPPQERSHHPQERSHHPQERSRYHQEHNVHPQERSIHFPEWDQHYTRAHKRTRQLFQWEACPTSR
ncbi:hypothetical protein CYMTET_24167 [Cymbomonas tetramitiformis]|uniref:Uncharacterized protein n=1 Tax=Cymbomonas tetramitiformis TaxID=36881 RepID=A0AAE0FWB7_9CHLO|nr:hypothetical protein CYMTET_24167 [Cymbomonas tetramitiformis]